jgi:hypothetical protein
MYQSQTLTRRLFRSLFASLAVLLTILVAAWISSTAAQVEQTSQENCEFTGVVEVLPNGGLIGDWVVEGRTVHVAGSTIIAMESGPVSLGSRVKVEGRPQSDGSVTATQIQVSNRLTSHVPESTRASARYHPCRI